VEEIAGVSPARAQRALREAGGRARLAIAVARLDVPAPAARAALRRHGGDLRALLEARRRDSRKGVRPG
jgi:N-acetylmuramic acid 6-phosphate (MurNAc-6-P) etherase